MKHNTEQLSVKTDFIAAFGDKHDGVIEFLGIVKGGVIEVGYYYGDAKPKNIIDISSQVGCPMQCKFCELGQEKFVRNLDAQEMFDQVKLMLSIARQYGAATDITPHKVTIAKTGEPLLNPELRQGLERIAEFGFSFKLSTVFPQASNKRLETIADFASQYSQPVRLQISLISTSEEYRKKSAGPGAAGFEEIRAAAQYWHGKNPARKVNLSLILTDEVPCLVEGVRSVFPQELFRFRFRNYVPTKNGEAARLRTMSRERFKQVLSEFRDAGYDVNEAATPTLTELRFGLAANVTRRRYIEMIQQAH